MPRRRVFPRATPAALPSRQAVESPPAHPRRGIRAALSAATPTPCWRSARSPERSALARPTPRILRRLSGTAPEDAGLAVRRGGGPQDPLCWRSCVEGRSRLLAVMPEASLSASTHGGEECRARILARCSPPARPLPLPERREQTSRRAPPPWVFPLDPFSGGTPQAIRYPQGTNPLFPRAVVRFARGPLWGVARAPRTPARRSGHAVCYFPPSGKRQFPSAPRGGARRCAASCRTVSPARLCRPGARAQAPPKRGSLRLLRSRPAMNAPAVERGDAPTAHAAHRPQCGRTGGARRNRADPAGRCDCRLRCSRCGPRFARSSARCAPVRL